MSRMGACLGSIVFAFCLTGCTEDTLPLAPPPDIHLPASTPADVVTLLQDAPLLSVSLSQAEIQRLASGYDGTRNLGDAVSSCNTNGYVRRNGDFIAQTEESTCYDLGMSLLGSDFKTDISSVATEIAFARACVAPRLPGMAALGCVQLSQLYEKRGALELALAVVKSAAKCGGSLEPEAAVREIDPDRPFDASNIELTECLKQEVHVLIELHRPDQERAVASELCNAADEIGCSYLSELGAAVNMRQVQQRQAELQAQDRAAADADRAADARVQADHAANNAAVVGAIRSLGSSNPNAVVNEANRQASRMVALGATNAAHDSIQAAGRTVADGGTRPHDAQQRANSARISGSGNAGGVNSTTTSPSTTPGSSASSSDTSTYTYSKPATDCLSYAADQNAKGILVTNNCTDDVILTWARPAGTHVGLDYAIQGGPDIVPAGGTDPIPPHPVRVFACHMPGTPTKPGHENSSGDDGMLEYTDTAFVCPSGNQATKKPE